MIQKRLFVGFIFALTIGAPRIGMSQWIKSDIASGAQALCFAQVGTNLFAGMLDSGLYVSSDDGTSWTPSGLAGKQVRALAAIGATLFAGTSDQIGDGAVYRSTNNGASWIATTGISTAVMCLAVRGTTLFAGTATGSGIFASSNNGATWNSETATGGATILALAVSGSNIFAGTDQGMFVSSNNGTGWEAINSGLIQSDWVYALAVSGANLFAATSEGVCLTTNNGTTWSVINSNSGVKGWFAQGMAASGSNVFAGTDSGVFLSTNIGSSWTSVSMGATDTNVALLGVLGSALYCGTYKTGGAIWHRPLSEMISTSAVADRPVMAASTAQAYPNPFSENTTVRFTTTERGLEQVSVVNLLGVEVARLFEGEMEAGEHSFEWDGKDQPRGAYFALIRTSNAVRRISLTLIR